MAIRDFLAKNRIAVGSALLVASWLAPFAWSGLAYSVIIVGIIALGIFVAQDWSGKYDTDLVDRKENNYDRALILSSLITLFLFFSYRIFIDHKFQSFITAIVVCAIFSLPYPKKIDLGESI